VRTRQAPVFVDVEWPVWVMHRRSS